MTAWLRRADAWVGLNVFHPPIIWLCQRLGYTQWRLSRDMWFLFGMYLVWTLHHHGHQGAAWIAMVLAALSFFRAVLLPPSAATPSLFGIRVLWWAVLPLDVWDLATKGEPIHVLATLWILVAEYAATITTLPPRKKKRPKGQRNRSHAHG